MESAMDLGDSKPEEKTAIRHFGISSTPMKSAALLNSTYRLTAAMCSSSMERGWDRGVRSWPAEQSYDVYDITSRVRQG